MGRSKRKRVAREQQQDFAKKSKKLGKRVRPDNFTDTSLRTRQIFVPNQTRPTSGTILEGNTRPALTGLTLNELLNRTSHHNVNSRVSAFNALHNALTNQTAVAHAALNVRLGAAMGAAGAALSDDIASVRESSGVLLKSSLKHLADPMPFLAGIRAHLLAALSHIRRDVRLHAARLIPELLSVQGVTPSALFPPPWTPLPALSEMLQNGGSLKQKVDLLHSLCSCLDVKAIEKKIMTEQKTARDVEMLKGRRKDRPFYYNGTPPHREEQVSTLFHCTASTERCLLLRRVCNVVMDALPSHDRTNDANEALFSTAVKTLCIVLAARNTEAIKESTTEVGIITDDLILTNNNKNNVNNKRSADAMKNDGTGGANKWNVTGTDITEDEPTDMTVAPRCVMRVLEDCIRHFGAKRIQNASAMLADAALEVGEPELCMQFLKRVIDKQFRIKSVDCRVTALRLLSCALIDGGEVVAHGGQLALIVASRFADSIRRRDARDAQLWFDCVKQAAYLAARGKTPDSVRRTLTVPSAIPAAIGLIASGPAMKPSKLSTNLTDVAGRDIAGILTVREAVNEAIDLAVDVFEAFAKESQSQSLKYSSLATSILQQAAVYPAHGAIDDTRARRIAKMAMMVGLLNSDAVATAIANGFMIDSRVANVAYQPPGPSPLAIALLDALEWTVSMPRTSCERPFAARTVALARSISSFISTCDNKDLVVIRSQLNRIIMAV